MLFIENLEDILYQIYLENLNYDVKNIVLIQIQTFALLYLMSQHNSFIKIIIFI